MTNNISFPKLGINFNINQVAIDIPIFGGIRWYGILIGIGIILAAIYCSRLAKKEGESEDIVIDLLLWALPVSIIMARTYYVVFSWDSYKDNLSEIFKIWEGGIAIYGGIIGAVVTAAIFSKVKKVNTLKLFDICCLGLLIGQAIGRWGNFVNAEAFGYECSYFWGMSINGGAPVHPTFLYESLWNTAGFFILALLNKKRPFYGFTFFSYIMWYGFGRFIIEGLRTDSLYAGTVRISQLVAFLCIIAGILGYWFCLNKKKSETK